MEDEQELAKPVSADATERLLAVLMTMRAGRLRNFIDAATVPDVIIARERAMLEEATKAWLVRFRGYQVTK